MGGNGRVCDTWRGVKNSRNRPGNTVPSSRSKANGLDVDGERGAVPDMGADATLVPFGILEASRGPQNLDQLWLAFGTSLETSDFIADALNQWWDERGPFYVGVKRLQIELDNGPEINSSRTQFRTG